MIEFDSDSKKLLILDMSNIAMRNAFAIVAGEPQDNRVWTKWTDTTVSQIFRYINQFSPERLVIAMDSEKYWRSIYYPEYKLNRVKFKEDCVIDYDNFQEYYASFMKELASVLTNICVLDIEYTEGDDIGAVLTKNNHGSETTLISADKDFNQLYKYKDFKRYDPIKKSIITGINPELDLRMKVILGDPGDGIPNIKRGVGPKKAEKLLSEDIMTCGDPVMIENYKLNKTLIDFDMIPIGIENMILEIYKEWTPASINKRYMHSWLMSKSPSVIDKWPQYSHSFEKLS